MLRVLGATIVPAAIFATEGLTDNNPFAVLGVASVTCAVMAYGWRQADQRAKDSNAALAASNAAQLSQVERLAGILVENNRILQAVLKRLGGE